MAQIDHPNGDGRIDVDVIDTETYRGTTLVQVEATDDDTVLTDSSGNSPWVEEDEIFESDDEFNESRVEADNVEGVEA